MVIISLLNDIIVGIFGMILSASFCDICWTNKKKWLLAGSMAMLLIIQGLVYFLSNSAMVRFFYPIITHVPLVLILCVFTKQRLWAVFAVLTAYLCCQIRRWLALLIVAVCSGSPVMQDITELLVTIPVLYVLLKRVAPSVRSISHSSSWVQSQFVLIPAIYYVFDYITQIYTDLLLKGNPVITEFMSFVCCIAYIFFMLRFSQEKWMRSQLEQIQDSLNLQISQAVREIELLRNSQEKTKAYHHDLRHHLQYVFSCIENEKLEQAQEYIQGICSEIEANKVTVFCENEAANLIFSAFAGRAKEQGISITIKACISKSIHVSESDLCVLLSNAMENALHSCRKLKEKGEEGSIEVSVFEKREKIFLQMINSCDSDITFVQGIPVTNQPNHGIGVQSICALVERYGGIYTFEVIEGKFILRVSI